MNFKLVSTVFLGATLLSGAYAATSTTSTSTQSIKNLYKKLEDSPLSMSLYTENTIYPVTKGKADSYESYNAFSFGYKLNSKGRLGAGASHVVSKTESKEGEGSWNDSYLTYSHKLLPQDKYGVNLSTGLTGVYNLDAKIRQKYDYYGYVVPKIKVSRSFGPFTLSGTYKRYTFVLTEQVANKSRVFIDRFKIGVDHSFTDKLSAGLSTYLYNYRDRSGLYTQKVRTIPSIDYKVNKKVGVTLLADFSPMRSHDGRLFVKNLQDKIGYALAVSLSAF